MKFSNAVRLVPVLAAFLLTGPGAADARVFSRWGGGAFGRAWGWELAYEADMQINNGKGIVKVYGAASSQADVMKKLSAHYAGLGATHFFYPGQAMGWGMALADGRVERFLVTSRDPGHTSVIYKISQTEDEYHKARPEYTRHQLEEVPVFPGSRPAYYNADASTRAVLEVSRTGAQPEVVFLHLDGALRDDGWVASLPSAGEMRIYQKGRDIAVLQVSASSGGHAVITRLLKRGAAMR